MPFAIRFYAYCLLQVMKIFSAASFIHTFKICYYFSFTAIELFKVFNSMLMHYNGIIKSCRMMISYQKVQTVFPQVHPVIIP